MPRIQSVSVCAARVRLVAATPGARYVEFFPDDQVLNFRRLIDRQLAHRDGDLILHQSPGLGFDFDEKAVQHYALDRARPWSVIAPARRKRAR